MAEKAWGQMREVDVTEIPPARAGKWLGMVEEARLRIENTPIGKSICIPIYKSDDVKPASVALRKSAEYVAQKRGIRIQSFFFEDGEFEGAIYVTVLAKGA